MTNGKNKITLVSILKDSSYNLSLFSKKDINTLESKIKIQKNKPYVDCIIREKEVQLKPEEVVRQLYTVKLISDYGYPKKRIRFEHSVQFGRETKSADIVVFDQDRPTVEYIIVEVKKPKLKDGKEQLKSYCNATGAPIGVWLNGGQISHYNRKDPIFFGVSEKAGKDNSGDYVYVKNGDGKSKLDKYGHFIVAHDLHNHKGELPRGIAEEFIDWAKKEKLSFWK